MLFGLEVVTIEESIEARQGKEEARLGLSNDNFLFYNRFCVFVYQFFFSILLRIERNHVAFLPPLSPFSDFVCFSLRWFAISLSPRSSQNMMTEDRQFCKRCQAAVTRKRDFTVGLLGCFVGSCLGLLVLICPYGFASLLRDS